MLHPPHNVRHLKSRNVRMQKDLIYNYRNYICLIDSICSWEVSTLSTIVEIVFVLQTLWQVSESKSNLQQQKLYLSYRPFSNGGVKIRSTIVEIVFVLQTLFPTEQTACIYNSRNCICLIDPYSGERKNPIYNSRNCICLID